MQNKVPEISVFFPFWNEEKNIRSVVEKAIPVLKTIFDKWEIIMIDDGSSDNTVKIAREMMKKNPNLRLIEHKTNRGYGAALRSGFDNARYNLIAFNDGDGQFDFSEITKFLKKLKDADVVIGFRKKRLDVLFRHILMSLLKAWDYLFFRITFKDIDCGFKVFKKDAVEAIYPLYCEGAMITTEILVKAKHKGMKIAQVEVSHYPRVYGSQSGGNLRVIGRAVLESLRLWFNIRFHYGRT